MKPKSVKLFDTFYLSAVGCNVASALIGWRTLAEKAGVDLEAASNGAAGMAGWLVGSSIFIFVLIALVLWSAISHFRTAFVRWLIAIAVLYGSNDVVEAVRLRDFSPISILNTLAIVLAAISVLVLFRADARHWFSATPEHPLPLD